MRRAGWSVLIALMALAACGDDDGTTTASDTTTTEATTTSTTPADAGPLPGEQIDVPPAEGANLAVVGVEAGDKLNVRVRPGADEATVFELEPLATDIVATGHNRRLDEGGIWAEITFDGRTGWANTSFLLQPGEVDDITSRILTSSGDRPRAGTLEALGRMIGEMRATQEPPSRIVIVDGTNTGDLGEITVDVIGLGDDSVGGERLHIFAEEDGGEFVMRTVEATALCSRGVSGGTCV